MIGLNSNEYREKVVLLKRQLNTADGDEKILIYESLYNCYVRMGLLLEAEKVLYDYLTMLRNILPKGKLVVEELRLSKLLIDNGKVQQGIVHMYYAIELCKMQDADNKEQYLGTLVHIHYTLSQRDEKFKASFNSYLQQYETVIKPNTTFEKLDYYFELAGTFFNINERKKGLIYKEKIESLLNNSTDIDEAFRERYRNYLQQISIAEMRADPDQKKLIQYVLDILERNKQEKTIPPSRVFFWLRTLANAYKKENNIEGLQSVFTELYGAINEYVEESVDNKIYEQKYQSDYFQQEQKLKEVEALNKIKDSVFSNFNHELRTPLNIILSNCELLERDSDTFGAGKKRLDTIKNQSYNLLNIIDQFIEINKTNLQFNQVNNEVGDLVQFMQMLESDFATMCEQKGIDLKFELKRVKELICELDFAKLERILYNLITNAIKFTNTGGKVTVSLTIDKNNSLLSIAISDTGIGIEDHQINTIFDQFYSPRNDQENIKTSIGFGIGLYLVRQLTNILGGTIEVISKPKCGSTFTLQVPLVIHIGAPQAFAIGKRLNYSHTENIVQKEKARDENNIRIDGHKPVLLIVEDNRDLLEVIAESLSPAFTIETATNGREALEMLTTILPDVVITDLMMPNMNGIELTTMIKSNPALNHLPVVMLTAKGSLPNRIKGWEAGIDVFLRKPFSIVELERCIQNIIQTLANDRLHIEGLLTKISVEKSKPETVGEKFVNDFKNYVLAHINLTDSHHASIAKHLGVDENSMYRKIKSLTGLAPVQLITKLKIAKAQELIEGRHYATLKEIAYNSGFNDPKYFSQVYKAERGNLPVLLKK